MPAILYVKTVRSLLLFAILAAILCGYCAGPTMGNEGQPHLYFFTSDGCAPCRQVEPAIEALGREGYPVTTIHTNRSPEWVQKFQIDRTPTVVMIADNKMVGRHAGLIDGVKLKQWFAAVGVKSGSTFTDKKGNAIPGGTKVVMNTPQANRPSAREELSNLKSTPSNSSDKFKTPTMHKGTRIASNRAEQKAMNATVLLRVEDKEGISYATGTVIHSRDGESLVLTCGHVFREAQGKGEISAEYGFGSGQTNRGSGELIYYDAEARDIGLVAIRTKKRIEPVKVAEASSSITKGRDVFSIGCDHGEDPTIRRTRIKNKAAYDGSIKYDIFGRPVDGRSGGGLFTKDGELIGVCNAAAVEVDEGIYAALDTIYWQLETANLRHLFGPTNTPTRIADNRSFQNQVASIQRPSPPSRSDTQPIRPINRQTVPSPRKGRFESERTPVSWNRGQSNGLNSNDREVIIIVRSKTNPNQTEAISINDPTPELLKYLDSMQTASTETRRLDVAQLRMQRIQRVEPVER